MRQARRWRRRCRDVLPKRLWQAATGLLFPAMRDGKNAKAGKDQAKGLSEADALRRLYKRALGIEDQVTRERVMVDKRVKKGERTVPIKKWEQVREPTERERLVLDGSERVAPVCFHAGRNAFAQALDAAGLPDEQIRELLDHESVKVTQGYQRRLGARAKLVPNVHQLAAVLAARPVGNAQCSQGGHIENEGTDEAKKKPRSFLRGFWLRGGDTPPGQRALPWVS